jgi:hypothetical protein
MQQHEVNMQARQFMMDRERMAASGQSGLLHNQEHEFLRQHQQRQREQELKMRSFEDAVRGGRP